MTFTLYLSSKLIINDMSKNNIEGNPYYIIINIMRQNEDLQNITVKHFNYFQSRKTANNLYNIIIVLFVY